MTNAPQKLFKIAVPVRGPELADREVEIATILKEVTAGSRLSLISPRRYGKN